MASHLQKPIEEVTQSKLQADPSATDPTHSDFVLPKGGSPSSDAASCISSAGEASTSAKDSDLDHESDSLKVNNSDSHSGSEYDVYWHQGHGGSNADLASQTYLLGPDALEIQYPVMQADNGSFVYLMPGLLPGYCTYFPVNTVGADGQYLSQDTYSPSHILQSPICFPEYYPAYGAFGDLQFTANPSLVGNGYEGFDSTPAPNCKKASIVHTANTHSKPSSKSDLSYSVEKKKSAPMLDVSSGRVSGSQLKPLNNKTLSGGSTIQSDALANICFPVTNGPTYNHGKSGYQYPYTFQNTKANVKGWASNEKQKMRSKKSDAFLNEQNQGPNTANGKGDFPCNGTTDGHLASEASMDIVKKNFLVKKDDYNLPDFPTKYEDALFFVIKSYSEDDIHKSIKYNVWASTPNGNKRLDAAYQDAQDRTTKKGSKCPVFLFFSVNASGQFCGVAEMVGRVDFDKTMGFWQQDKWKGYFPVKWHIIKDVPNPHLRRIILENNENKPVTNSRDTQEVKFRQGIEFLNIFKNYVSKTSILDDFDFYESREKVMQEKRIRESLPYPVSMQLKVDDLTATLGSVNISSEGHAGATLGN